MNSKAWTCLPACRTAGCVEGLPSEADIGGSGERRHLVGGAKINPRGPASLPGALHLQLVDSWSSKARRSHDQIHIPDLDHPSLSC